MGRVSVAGACLSFSLLRSDEMVVVLQKSGLGLWTYLREAQLWWTCGAASEGGEESTPFSHCWSSSHG